MTVVTYSQARQNFANLLDLASKEGEVRVKRRGGQVYTIRPDKRMNSPLNIRGIRLNLTASDIVRTIREIRRK